jgi:hypothetical protein
LAWIPERVIKLLVGYRTILQPDRMQHDEAKAALVTMANQLTSNYLADNGSVRFFYRLQEVSDSAISYDAVLDSLLHVSRGNLRDAIDAITKETDGLWMALMRHVLMPRLPKACYDDERVVTAIEEILRGCVVGDRTAAQIASAGLAWREAGRPAVCVWQTIPATGKEISRFFAWEAWERERESKPASTGGVEDFSAALEPFFVSGALKAGLAKLDAVIGEVQNEKVQAGFQPPMPPDSEMEGQPSLRRLTGLLAIIMATVALYFLKLSAH